ncbi:transposase [Polyangium spumosum]|uniref:Transposase n=1 Tax=Polyangium spumosum TaxID=889282 RepID=A0A6N7Q9V7_9BACT|nr:transposase [Polyangium spumosum]MRG97661.1 transposase [Polyangium spumosum]
MANVLDPEKRLRVLAALVDGNSERAVERMTDVDRKTVRRLALTFGQGALNLHNALARDLRCSLIQCDEIWSYVGKKQARVTEEDGPDVGEAYTFTALDASSRFVIGWYVGKRDEQSAREFMTDVRARLVVMPMVATDGFAPYVAAVGASFGPGVDYAVMSKNYTSKRRRDDDHRYEPPRDPFITKKPIFGAPDMGKVSTAYVERQNATMRHTIGRLRRLCYAFSKKAENHRAAISLAYAYYNLCHVVSTLRVTPAMAAGVTSHVWSLEEFMQAILSAAPVERPEKKPLAPRVPEGPARELPNGRGFLRVVDGGKAKPSEVQKPPPPSPVPVRYPTPHVEDYEERWEQMDLLLWRKKERQLAFFNEDDDS